MSARQPLVSLNCEQCGAGFSVPSSKMRAYHSRKSIRRFCSKECFAKSKIVDSNSKVYGACEKCGGPIMASRYPNGSLRTPPKSRRFCSQSCQVSSQTRKKNHGAGSIDKWGYRIICRDGKHIPEHRYVMEFYLGRALLPEETVHHKNGHRSDNRLDNLELWSSKHGSGQRVEDKVDFCIEFLKQYPEFLERRGLKIVPVKDGDKKKTVLHKSATSHAHQMSLFVIAALAPAE